MPAIKKIAQSLRIDDISARNFCLAVQRHFNQSPSFDMISRAMEQLPPQKRGIEGVVEWLRCEWPNLQYKGKLNLKNATKTAKTVPTSPTSVTSNKQHPGKPIPKSKKRSGYSDRNEPESFSPVLWTGRDPRNAVEQLPKCPHGVVKGRKCALCDPKGYKLYHGDD